MGFLMNDAECAVDLAVGQELRNLPTVTTIAGLREQYAKAIFARVKPQNKLVALEIGCLCQPL